MRELRRASVGPAETPCRSCAARRDAQSDPGKFIAMPNRLLESQPALRRLKDGLVDTQLGTAALLGTMTDDHPLVRAAKESEAEVGRHLHNELEVAVRGVKLELQLNDARKETLDAQLDQATQRLEFLAGFHATYVNQVAQSDNRTAVLKQAEENLADARAALAGTQAASLISRIDTPEAGINPIGPGRSAIAMAGIVGGLLAGLGIVLLSAPSSQPVVVAEESAQSVQQAVVSVPMSITPAAEPVGDLSFKQALQRIQYASKV